MSAEVVMMPAPKKAHKKLARLKLTEDRVKRIPPMNPAKDKYPVPYLDTDLKGFMVIAHRESKSYYAQRDIRGKTVRVAIGKTDLMDASEARQRARKLLATMADGINPNDRRAQEEAEGFTLRDAIQAHLYERKKERSDKTLKGYENAFNTHLSDFMTKPLKWIGEHQELIEKRHDEVTRRGADTEAIDGRGKRKRKPAPYAANGMVRAFRAVYNFARKKHPELDLPEFRVPDLNPEAPRDSALSLEELPQWYAAVNALTNPIRRDYHLFVLFTGMRRTAAAEMQWEHVDLENKCVLVPSPKGGAKKAFYLPLSDHLVTLLESRRMCTVTAAGFPGSPWVFPAIESASGHITEPTEKKHSFLRRYGPHALRHTYASVAQAAGLNLTDIKFLLNHRSSDVTVRYMKAMLTALRESQQQVTNYYLKVLAPKQN
jgi:integrase